MRWYTAWAWRCLMCAFLAQAAVPAPTLLYASFDAVFSNSSALLDQQLNQLGGLLSRLLADPNLPPSFELAQPSAAEACKLALPHIAAKSNSSQYQPPDISILELLGGVDRHLSALLAQAAQPPHHSYSLTRRAVLGMLAAHHQRQRDLGPSEEEQARRVAQKLHDLHKRGLAAKGLLEYIHVSKAAGSTICLLGERNKCTTKVFGPNNGRGNCLITKFDDYPRWVPQAQHQLYFGSKKPTTFVRHGVFRRRNYTCAQRQEYMKQRNYTFYANEYAVLQSAAPDADSGAPQGSSLLCSEFAHLLVFRHPYARLQSHLRYIRQQYERRYKSRYSSKSGKALPGNKASGVFQRFGLDEWNQFAPAAVDNYYIRTLLGETVFHLPAGQLTERHLLAAQEVLARVDVLLDSDSNVVDFFNLRMGLGWRHGLGAVRAKSSRNKRSRGQSLRSSSRLHGLVERNAMDLQLYNLSQLLAGLDAAMYWYLAGGQRNATVTKEGSAYACGWVGVDQAGGSHSSSSSSDETGAAMTNDDEDDGVVQG